MNGNQLAIYWDFDNIHISVAKDQGIATNSYTPQKRIVELSAIMDNLQAIGPVAINRAYANWQWMWNYKDDLLKLNIDLIQLFPRGLNAKNGADIRLALDAYQDACRLPNLTHFVIISGDSDFISAAQKLRELGKTVIGIGTRTSTTPYWSHACSAAFVGLRGSAPKTPAPKTPSGTADPTTNSVDARFIKALKKMGIRNLPGDSGRLESHTTGMESLAVCG